MFLLRRKALGNGHTVDVGLGECVKSLYAGSEGIIIVLNQSSARWIVKAQVRWESVDILGLMLRGSVSPSELIVFHDDVVFMKDSGVEI